MLRKLSPALLLFLACATDEASVRADQQTPASGTAADAPSGGESAATDSPELKKARIETALNVLHRDGLDVRVERLTRMGDIVARAFEGAVLRGAVHEQPTIDPSGQSFLFELRRQARDAYKRDVLRSSLAEGIARRDTDGLLGQVLAFFETDIASRAAEGRLHVSTPAGQKALASILSRLPSHPPDEVRLKRIGGLLEASRQVELFMALSFDASSDVMEAVTPHLPTSLSAGADDWLTGQSAGRQSFSARVTRTLLFQDWYALRGLDDDELTTAINFWTSKAGRWYATARLDTLREMSLERARVLGTGLATAK